MPEVIRAVNVTSFALPEITDRRMKTYAIVGEAVIAAVENPGQTCTIGILSDNGDSNLIFSITVRREPQSNALIFESEAIKREIEYKMFNTEDLDILRKGGIDPSV